MTRSLPTLAVVAFLIASAPRLAAACVSDNDCKGDRICEAGTCVTPSGGSAVAAPAAMVEDVPVPDASMAFSVNVLGLLQFGLTPTAEFGGQTTGLVKLRLIPLGMIPHLLAGASDDVIQMSSFGVGAGFRHYLSEVGTMRGFFIGGGAEFLNIVSKEEGWDQNIGGTYTSRMLVPNVDVGYRWIFSGGFMLGVGLSAGYAIEVSQIAKSAEGVEYDEAWRNEHVDDGSTPFGFLRLDLGWVM